MQKKDEKRRDKGYRPKPQNAPRARESASRVREARESYEMPENYVIGRNAVKELLASERDIDRLYIQLGEREGSINLLLGEAAKRRIPITELDRAKLDRMSAGGAHQGIIAVAAERNYNTVDEILAYAEERGEPPLVILCDGVEDPHNLGAIIRNAECCGVHGIILPKRRSALLTPTVAKSAAGATEHMRIAKVTNLSQTIDELKERGMWFYCADMGAVPYYETDLTSSVGIVLGNEGDGVSRLVKEKCDFTLSIPLYGRVDSMNVSCASAVLLAEAAKQRHR